MLLKYVIAGRYFKTEEEAIVHAEARAAKTGRDLAILSDKKGFLVISAKLAAKLQGA